MTDKDLRAEAVKALEEMQPLLEAPEPTDWPRVAELADRVKQIGTEAQKSPDGPATIHFPRGPKKGW